MPEIPGRKYFKNSTASTLDSIQSKMEEQVKLFNKSLFKIVNNLIKIDIYKQQIYRHSYLYTLLHIPHTHTHTHDKLALMQSTTTDMLFSYKVET